MGLFQEFLASSSIAGLSHIYNAKVSLHDREWMFLVETFPKAQRTRGLSSFHKFHTNVDQLQIRNLD